MQYLFYDLETTGLCESFDQVVRFAAIRTDANFNEIDQFEIDIKLSSKVLMFSDLPIVNIQPSLYHEAAIDIFAQKMFTRTQVLILGS